MKRPVIQTTTLSLVVSGTIVTARGFGRVRGRRLCTALVGAARCRLVAVSARRRSREAGCRGVEPAAVAGGSASAGLVGWCAAAAGVPSRLLLRKNVSIM
jgi:hypothetical protein